MIRPKFLSAYYWRAMMQSCLLIWIGVDSVSYLLNRRIRLQLESPHKRCVTWFTVCVKYVCVCHVCVFYISADFEGGWMKFSKFLWLLTFPSIIASTLFILYFSFWLCFVLFRAVQSDLMNVIQPTFFVNMWRLALTSASFCLMHLSGNISTETDIRFPHCLWYCCRY